MRMLKYLVGLTCALLLLTRPSLSAQKVAAVVCTEVGTPCTWSHVYDVDSSTTAADLRLAFSAAGWTVETQTDDAFTISKRLDGATTQRGQSPSWEKKIMNAPADVRALVEVRPARYRVQATDIAPVLTLTTL